MQKLFGFKYWLLVLTFAFTLPRAQAYTPLEIIQAVNLLMTLPAEKIFIHLDSGSDDEFETIPFGGKDREVLIDSNRKSAQPQIKIRGLYLTIDQIYFGTTPLIELLSSTTVTARNLLALKAILEVPSNPKHSIEITPIEGSTITLTANVTRDFIVRRSNGQITVRLESGKSLAGAKVNIDGKVTTFPKDAVIAETQNSPESAVRLVQILLTTNKEIFAKRYIEDGVPEGITFPAPTRKRPRNVQLEWKGTTIDQGFSVQINGTLVEPQSLTIGNQSILDLLAKQKPSSSKILELAQKFWEATRPRFKHDDGSAVLFEILSSRELIFTTDGTQLSLNVGDNLNAEKGTFEIDGKDTRVTVETIQFPLDCSGLAQ